MSMQNTTYQEAEPSEVVAGSEDEPATQSTDRGNIEPEVSDSLLESDSRGGSVPPSSESEYCPTPEKRRRVAIMQQPVEPALLGSGIFVCLTSQVSTF